MIRFHEMLFGQFVDGSLKDMDIVKLVEIVVVIFLVVGGMHSDEQLNI
jgi:hypothetical protein